MKKNVFWFFIILIFSVASSYGQAERYEELNEVVLSDVHLSRHSETQRVQVLTDSVLDRNEASLTSLLRFNTPIYFKENGPGMVSSASFRGTTASQTAVIWNGININSQFTGQTDFNTILTSGYDQVAVRSGGGSVLYGSGAIGGSVHLNNKLSFKNGWDNRIKVEGGSFNTFYGNVDTRYSSEDISLQVNLAHNRSDNDFPYHDSQKSNQNGDYENSGVSAAAAWLINHNNSLKFYTNFYDGERGFSGSLYARSKSKYLDLNSRNLLEWKSYFSRFTSILRLAFLAEEYKYYDNRNLDIYDFGNAKTEIAKYELGYAVQPNMEITGLLEVKNTTGEGSNIEGEQQRKTGSAGILFTHHLNRLKYELSARTEFSELYDPAFLFSAGAAYQVANAYAVKVNISKNYRIPTFNDLFWYAGGNKDLEPENSLQAELTQEIDLAGINFSLTGFFIETRDLLRWIPTSSGQWIPENTEEARNYGLESSLRWQHKINAHKIDIFGTYAYTRAVDQALKKELIYVPAHKLTASAAYSFERFSGYFQLLYNGEVYTSGDNNYHLPAYSVANVGFQYELLKNTLQIGVEARNVFDTPYQIMLSRPMPGRSFNSSLTFKF